ncbi:LDCC motif putative metal-binding protein [Caproicibacter sp.]
MKFWNKIKKSINRSLEKMAKENKKEFGDGVPDCCKMNRQGGNKPGNR